MEGRQPRSSAPDVDLDADVVAEQYNLLEQVKAFLDVDDDWLAAIYALQIKMAQMEQTENDILREIRDQRDPGILGEFPTEMSHDVPADTPTESPNVVERVPSENDESRIVAVSLGWPDGANNAVGIQLRTSNGLVLMPRNDEDDYIAFNDFSDTWDLRYTLEPGETLEARTINLDTQNSHFVNIVPHIEEVDPSETEG